MKLSAYNKELEEIGRKGDLSGDQVRLLIEQSEAEYIKVKGIFQEAFSALCALRFARSALCALHALRLHRRVGLH